MRNACTQTDIFVAGRFKRLNCAVALHHQNRQSAARHARFWRIRSACQDDGYFRAKHEPGALRAAHVDQAFIENIARL
jgi:hypothetical protein